MFIVLAIIIGEILNHRELYKSQAIAVDSLKEVLKEQEEFWNDSFTVEYSHRINGYHVKAVVKPDESDVLIMKADIIFEKEGKIFTLHTSCYGDTMFCKGRFDLYDENPELFEKYRKKKKVTAEYHENREDGELFSKYTPFFFRDLDFDGVAELVIVHYSMAVRYGNGYDVYRIVDGTPMLIDYAPYNRNRADWGFGMTDYPEFDFNKKTISCPYPEGERMYEGRIIYGVSQKKKDVITAVNGSNFKFNHLDSIGHEVYIHDEDEGEEYEDKMSLNIAYSNMYVEYEDSIERRYQKLISMLPQFRDEFDEEKLLWQEYQKTVRAVAECEDYGTSTPIYVADVLSQGVKLWEESFANLFLNMLGKPFSFSKTEFSSTMVGDAYSAFIEAIGRDGNVENKTKYQESLRKEQKYWNNWMEHRQATSKKLSTKLRSIYDGCTNQVIRTKLLQLKNQNQSLGVTSNELMKCVLPEDCSDKALMDYPGFDKAWALHRKFMDWYPNFEKEQF